jgi:hypothetical protein
MGIQAKKPPVKAASRALVRLSANGDGGLRPSRSDDRDHGRARTRGRGREHG